MAVSSAITTTLDKIFVSHRDCVLDKRQAAEANLAASFHTARTSAETDFQAVVAFTISDSIETLNAALRSAAAEFAAKQDSVVNAITHARWSLIGPSPVPSPPPPPCTNLAAMADNTTLVGSTKVAWADSRTRRLQTPSISPSHPDTAPPNNPYPPYFFSGTRTWHGDDTVHYGGARANHSWPHYPAGGHNGWLGSIPSNSTNHSPRSPSDVTCGASSERYHCGQYSLDKFIPLGKEFLNSIGFTDISVYSEIMRLHRVICQCWHNRQYNSFSPQKESILKSSAFSMRLLLEKFNAPSIINWYKCLASTCKAFCISLVLFDAIQFGRWHKGLCLPGLGFECYDNMASALCTAMPICLDKADGRVRAMVSGVETKTRNGYEIMWTLLFRYIPDFDPTKIVNKPRWDRHNGDVIQ